MVLILWRVLVKEYIYLRNSETCEQRGGKTLGEFTSIHQPDKKRSGEQVAKMTQAPKTGTSTHTLVRIYPIVNLLVGSRLSTFLAHDGQIYPLLINLGFWDLNAAALTVYQSWASRGPSYIITSNIASERCSTSMFTYHPLWYIWWREKKSLREEAYL